MKNEFIYQIITSINDLFFPPSARTQKKRYFKRYGIQDEDVFFVVKGFYCDACVLRGRNFYKRIQEIGNLFKKSGQKMEIRTRRVSKNILELTIKDLGITITTDVIDMNGLIDENLIQNLRDVADEFEEHNINVTENPKYES